MIARVRHARFLAALLCGLVAPVLMTALTVGGMWLLAAFSVPGIGSTNFPWSGWSSWP